MNPILSVVMPTYNGEKFITETLESVQQQHEQGIELIVVDDGSTDRTLDIVRDFAKLFPIRLFTPGRIGNWVAISNIGIREAKGEWVCFLQQDDFWLPGRIATLRAEIKKTEGALVLHNARFVGPSGQNLGPWTCPLVEGDVSSDKFIERLLIHNFIAVLSPTFRRSAVIDCGGLDESLWVAADWDLWLRLGALGPVRFIDETLGAFRIHPASQAVARERQPNEWGDQLTTIMTRHFQTWHGMGKRRDSVKRAAMASIAVNSALSAASRGESVQLLPVLLKLLALGPAGWHRYLRDSRIVQRVRPRLKVSRQQKDVTRGNFGT